MTLHGDRLKSGWDGPMRKRTRTIVMVMASAIVIGAIVATVVLGIPFF
ncbi:MAG: hypothetical protein JWM50_1836 [Microbacteriaceae bacterium]|nr:hypothetical protein [Microbacteriaceae bacterium]